MDTTIQSDRPVFRKGFFRMLAVIALQNVIVYSVSLLDNIMLGSYTELVEVGHKYQGDSKIMFDKMQDFAYIAETLASQLDDATKMIESIRTASSESANAVGEFTNSVLLITEHVEDIRESNEENDRIANKLSERINQHLESGV